MQRNTYRSPINPHQVHRCPSQTPQHPLILRPIGSIQHSQSPTYPYSPADEARLRDEVLYLHSLWHRGPPSHPKPPYSQTPRFLKPSNPTNFKKTLKPHLVADKEWPIGSVPRWPSPSGSSWPEFRPVITPVTRSATAEEKERVLGVRVQLKAVDSCSGLFRKEEGSDSDVEEEDGDDVAKLEFLMKVFEEDEELRGFYKKNCESGEFYCLVCGVLRNKLGRKYKNCVALVQHSVTVSNTKNRKVHRAYGHVICKVLGWDIKRLPSQQAMVGDGSDLSLDNSCQLQGEIDNCAVEKDSSIVVERKGGSANTNLSEAGLNCKTDAVVMETDSTGTIGCSELTQIVAG